MKPTFDEPDHRRIVPLAVVMEEFIGTLGLVAPGERPDAAVVERACRQFRVLMDKYREDHGDVAADRLASLGRGPRAGIPDAAHIMRLRCPRSATRIQFLEFMRDRSSATYLELSREVHGNSDLGDDAITRLVRRTNQFLEEYAFSFRFQAGSGRVVKHEDG